jgi:AcrR family transcriptional regulator
MAVKLAQSTKTKDTKIARAFMAQQRDYVAKNTLAEKLKGYIAESLLRLMKEKPYPAITISEIASKAGVNRSTYYRSFKSKDDIIKFFYYNKILCGPIENTDDKNKIKKQFLKMFYHYLEYKEELMLLYKNGLSCSLLDALNDLYTTTAREPSLKEQCRIYRHTGAVYNSFMLWFSNNMNESPENMSEIYSPYA